MLPSFIPKQETFLTVPVTIDGPGVLFILIVSTTVKSQTTHPVKSSAVFFGLDFALGSPVHEFKTYNDDVAAGGGS